ncbi:FCS-Like Zinc finger 1-like [Lolium rigidum]|uniref:FCS-Like Zinc finger 1-like n=1 Tax=Lolium rigidum TaxID=89674 RepID=UPI001F5D9EA5|nr:FCS-Like Zinc finger 1-like [Lolium rigidum]XP_047071124.1 FCS-Like Zinc finger 1-like [Lolium rigidum]XP_051212803.1 FCS-Like Zinc finger 1-like [Lolium perenne]
MVASVASAFFFDAEPAGERGMPAMNACALCAKPLASEKDIFMYRGDTPFCSDECRHKQMRLDVVCEKNAARTLRPYSSLPESHCG